MVNPISVVGAETAKETITESLKETAEAKVGESPVQNMMETVENSSLETLKAQNIESLATLNKNLEGKVHPVTNIPYNNKIVEGADGNKIRGVFPDFKEHRSFEVKLPENLHMETDKVQFDYCNDKLKESYEKGSLNNENFSDRQLEQIKNGHKPEGLTWHHNEKKGRMELVNSDIHQATAHTGGKSIWGGGQEAR